MVVKMQRVKVGVLSGVLGLVGRHANRGGTCVNTTRKSPRVAASLLNSVVKPTSLLRVNKLIGEEIAAVLYEEVPFEVDLSYKTVRIGNKGYNFRGLTPRDDDYKYNRLNINMTLVPGIFHKIRNFQFTIYLNCSGASDDTKYLRNGLVKNFQQDILLRDYRLLELRDTLRKFIQVLRPRMFDLKSINNLEVTPLDDNFLQWTANDTHAAVALAIEPLRHLEHVERPVLHDIRFRETRGWSHVENDALAIQKSPEIDPIELKSKLLDTFHPEERNSIIQSRPAEFVFPVKKPKSSQYGPMWLELSLEICEVFPSKWHFEQEMDHPVLREQTVSEDTVRRYHEYEDTIDVQYGLAKRYCVLKTPRAVRRYP
ncbi:hypothetical protein BU23DRAFT_566461 [Bimuria novae-zelandiae CBS 107.79]|uniref:Uncharacterized protein n=1 Tax=Bimuria novae-zelandiae CBS 107.79 TaxID=1447943 RepID=A0A6A5VLB0_9PLEO|nr:hypothetical protein BU23DRAFT_566461 [Bimuria novae-zelandiae CBS 107.79]